MGIGEIILALGSLASLGLFAWKKWQKTPDQKRRESMVNLDKALKKAKEEHSLKDLSKWFGKRL